MKNHALLWAAAGAVMVTGAKFRGFEEQPVTMTAPAAAHSNA